LTILKVLEGPLLISMYMHVRNSVALSLDVSHTTVTTCVTNILDKSQCWVGSSFSLPVCFLNHKWRVHAVASKLSDTVFVLLLELLLWLNMSSIRCYIFTQR